MTRPRSRAERSLARGAAALAIILFAPLTPELAAEGTAPSLYQRLGGYDFIARFVDTAFPRVASDPQLRRLFQGHSRDSQVRQRQLIVDALCAATGGPCLYVGRPMGAVHEGLGITASDWEVFVGILGRTLEELKIRPPEKADFLGLLETRFGPEVVQLRPAP